MSTYGSKTILDYDPWWFYRHAVEILENNLIPPAWDLLSFYPPGRPNSALHGWSYIMIGYYKIASLFTNISFMDIAKLAPVITVMLSVIPAFFLGRLLSNKWGGLATALFATLTPTLIGVSMAGYCDTDAPVVLLSLITTYAMVLGIKKRTMPFIILAIIIQILFIYTWFFGWYVILFFTLFIPALFVFRIIESMMHERKIAIDINPIWKEVKTIAIPIIIILVSTNIIAYILAAMSGFTIGFSTIIDFILINLGFITRTGSLVNISVAELQTVNILTRDGFFSIADRIGMAPTILTLFVLPLLVLFKLVKKEKINFIEIYLFLWALLTFYMILNGVRFSIQFSTAAAVAAGYVIGNLVKYLKKDVIGITVFGFILFMSIVFVSNSIQIGYSGVGMEVSNNWINALDWLKQNADKDSLIVTWWDPGHIIAGYTGLKVHADGAHCPVGQCIPYNHDIRIQDMGRIFSTNDENEALNILKKYKSLTPEQCQAARDRFGSIVPDYACKPVTDMYVIASSDLIGKYHWMSYFGLGEAKDFFQMDLTNFDQQQVIFNYAGGAVSLVAKGDQLVPVYQGRYIIKEVVYFINGQQKYGNFANATNAIDGLLWVDPSFRLAIFMQPGIKDSIFTRMFFWNGEGLKHFELVYQNPELRIFKVVMSNF